MEEGLITFVVTKACQLNCKYCYEVGKNNEEQMSLSTAMKAIDYILDYKQFPHVDMINFNFIGGEPLLEIDLIDKITSYIVEKIHSINHPWRHAYKFSITTNGILYNSKKVQQFIKKHLNHLEISISIDGNRKKNDINRVFSNGCGSYDLIIDNVRLWLKQLPDSITKIVVSSEDIPYVFESVKHLISLGLKRIDINPVLENVWKQGDDNVYLEQLLKLADYIIDNKLYNEIKVFVFEDAIGHPLTKYDAISPCQESLLTIDGSGNFYKCLRFADFSLKNKNARAVGNIQRGLIHNLLRPYLTMNNLTVIADQCVGCSIAKGCRWCPGENYDTSELGSVFLKATSICDIHKARVKAKNYYNQKLTAVENGRLTI